MEEEKSLPPLLLWKEIIASFSLAQPGLMMKVIIYQV